MERGGGGGVIRLWQIWSTSSHLQQDWAQLYLLNIWESIFRISLKEVWEAVPTLSAAKSVKALVGGTSLFNRLNRKYAEYFGQKEHFHLTKLDVSFQNTQAKRIHTFRILASLLSRPCTSSTAKLSVCKEAVTFRAPLSADNEDRSISPSRSAMDICRRTEPIKHMLTQYI